MQGFEKDERPIHCSMYDEMKCEISNDRSICNTQMSFYRISISQLWKECVPMIPSVTLPIFQMRIFTTVTFPTK